MADPGAWARNEARIWWYEFVAKETLNLKNDLTGTARSSNSCCNSILCRNVAWNSHSRCWGTSNRDIDQSSNEQ
jgi:hypothetical protein